MAERESPTYLVALRHYESLLQQSGQDPSAAAWLLTATHHWTRTQLIQHYHDQVMPEVWARFQMQMARVLQGEPVQYVLGRAFFFGHWVKVTPATLIPRQETEELVEWILAQHPTSRPLRVLDVGTGSGVIGIALKLARPTWSVTMTDVSVAAVAVAQENAQALKASVRVVAGDLLAPVAGEKFDLVVSNPPYIAPEEESVMDASVINYEPSSALFAPAQGLAFYHRFARELPDVLTPNGEFFAEFGYHQGAAIRDLFTTAFPHSQVTIRQDLSGHDRMLRVDWSR